MRNMQSTTWLVILFSLLLQNSTSYRLVRTGNALKSSVLCKKSINLAVSRSAPPSPSITSSPPLELTKDGGVSKIIVSAGTGRRIEAGDILAVEYVGYVKDNKKPFARSQQARFTFKDGTMIKGWDIVVGSMRVGEKAKFQCTAGYAYGDKGVMDVIPPGATLEFEMKVLAWLGNQMKPESLFQKDLDVDPFIASTPETIQEEFNKMQTRKEDKFAGSIFDIYLRRLRNISFGFGGSNFFASQSGEAPPWYLNPNLTFPSMVLIVLLAFWTVFVAGGVREKGGVSDIELSAAAQMIRALV